MRGDAEFRRKLAISAPISGADVMLASDIPATFAVNSQWIKLSSRRSARSLSIFDHVRRSLAAR